MTAAAPMVKQRHKALAILRSWHWFWVVPSIVVLALAFFVTYRPVQVLPRIALSPGYLLVNQEGERLSSEDMRGKITLYNMTYTNCTQPCVSSTGLMLLLQEQLPQLEQGDIPVEFVTISIDHERDTPEVLQAYAASIGADQERWHFLTGAPDRLKWVVGSGFGLFYEQQDDGFLAMDQGMMLVDWTGTLRAEYRRTLPEIDLVMRDLGLLLSEVENNQGAGRLIYEAAHLFACYPR